MNVSDLLQPGIVKPVWRCGVMALLLWWLVWWRERPARSSLPLAVLALAWAACHLMVTRFSYQFPPKQPEDWLFFGAAGLLVVAVWGWRGTERRIPVPVFGALLLAASAWLAFHHMPYLFLRDESFLHRTLWTLGGVAGLLATFITAEYAAQRASPCALMAGLAIFAILAALGLWSLSSPERAVARPLAAAAVALAGAVAALIHRRHAAVPHGVAGWFAGGVVLLLITGCLSRAVNVPVWPMAAGVAAMPVAAILLGVYARLFLSGYSLAFLAAMLLAGTAIYGTSACEAERIRSTSGPAEPTGADDSGAYE